VGLERDPLSLVSTIEELLERKSSGSGLESREHGLGNRHADYVAQQKLVLTSPTRGGRSVSIVRPRTQATDYSCNEVVSTSDDIVFYDRIRNVKLSL
jgi:hypothetical protein